MEYPKIILKAGKDAIMDRRHPWVFSNALKTVKDVENGAIADLYSADGNTFLARGYYNALSQITFRVLTHDAAEAVDAVFFERRFRKLNEVRERFIDTAKTNAYRVCFAESDGLPGLIVDKYGSTFVIQLHTLGMDRLRDMVVAGLKAAFGPTTIYERSDVDARLQDGLTDQPAGLLYGKDLAGPKQITENGIPFWVDIVNGQKTGHFLDQRENRLAIQKYVEGETVLNCFCYTGGFSVYAALAGAKETVSVDSSGPALETAKKNFELSGIDVKKHSFLDQDVFKALDEFKAKKRLFDVIILDPPAFVKNRHSLPYGLKAYRFINERALGLLHPGGVLITSSCSAAVSDDDFQKMLGASAARAGCSLKALEIRNQPIDHPYNVHFPEGKYLKFYVMLKG